jgi:hypothetical protein
MLFAKVAMPLRPPTFPNSSVPTTLSDPSGPFHPHRFSNRLILRNATFVPQL